MDSYTLLPHFQPPPIFVSIDDNHFVFVDTDSARFLASFSAWPFERLESTNYRNNKPIPIRNTPVSAPLNQLEDCIAELRSKGYDVPIYPREPANEAEREIQKTYQTVMGSAVNPVLREGNSDRRVAPPVKSYAQKNPHRMGIWSKASRTHVAHMTQGDFFGSEQSTIIGNNPTSVQIEFHPKNGGPARVLKNDIPLEAGEVIDASCMSAHALTQFLEDEIEDAKNSDILFSIHLKATMMKVSDPIMFGHCIKVFFKDVFKKHGDILDEIGADPKQGLASILEAVENKVTDKKKKKEIILDFKGSYGTENRPWLAMVNSDKGITNLHAPNDIIIDASMPVVIRDSGMMWNEDGVRTMKYVFNALYFFQKKKYDFLAVHPTWWLTPPSLFTNFLGTGGLQVRHPW